MNNFRKIFSAALVIMFSAALFVGESREAAAAGGQGTVGLLLHMDGPDESTTFIDSSEYAHTVLRAANQGYPQIDTSQFRFGGASGQFPVPAAHLTVADHEALEFGSGDFTIEAWFRESTPPNMDFRGGGVFNIFSKGPVNLRIQGSSVPPQSATFLFFISDATGILVQQQSSDAILSLDNWYHIAVTRQGSTIRLFVNGIHQASQPVGTFTGSIPNTGHSAIVGSTDNGISNKTAWVDEVRVVKGAALYTSNFTPPTAPFPNPTATPPPPPATSPELLMCQLDLSNTQAQVTALQAQIVTLQSEIAQLQAANSSSQSQIAQLEQQLVDSQAQVTTLQSQISGLESDKLALQGQVTQLTEQVQNLQAELAQFTAAIADGLTRIQNDLRRVFRNPAFVIPGATIIQKYENVINSIIGLNKGRKQGIYKNLGGKIKGADKDDHDDDN